MSLFESPKSLPCWFFVVSEEDWQRRKPMGNMMEQEIFEIWEGNFMTKFRKDLLNGKRCNKPCSDCNADGTLLGKNHAAVWRSIYKLK